MTFWDHLDELRNTLLRIAVAVFLVSIAVFMMKEKLFEVVLAPGKGDFVTYRLVRAQPFALHLMNTGLTEQFMVHVRTALCVGVLVASPYALYALFRFVAPGLYESERYYAVRIVTAAYVMFIVGVMINYLVVFPFTVRFLGTYQVSASVENMLTLQSYVDTLLGMSLVMGIVAELPVVCAIMGRMGLMNGSMMREYRRHALVAILIVAAVITPTTDVFTLLVVSVPIYVLYEISIIIVGYTQKKH